MADSAPAQAPKAEKGEGEEKPKAEKARVTEDPERVSFLEMAALFALGKESTFERFGSLINASVFDAANISGTLKQMGLIDFTSYYPGPNEVVITDEGTKLKADADAKATEALDALDEEILRQMSGGKRYPTELRSTLNLRPRDLAFRLWKLYKQNFMSYELKNGKSELMLTEQGFLKAKSMQEVQVPKAGAKPEEMKMQNQTGMKPQNGGATQAAKPLELKGKPLLGRNGKILVALIIIAGIALGAAYYLGINFAL